MLLVIMILMLVVSLIVLFLSVSVVTGIFITKVPFVSSQKKSFKSSMEVAGLKPGELLIDLGCGKAHHLIYADKKLGARCVGYELSLWPYLWSKFNILVWKSKARVYFKDFFKADISQADVIYCYLFPEIMDKLEPKFKKELKPGARVVSYGFKMSKAIAEKIEITNENKPNLGKIYLYKY